MKKNLGSLCDLISILQAKIKADAKKKIIYEKSLKKFYQHRTKLPPKNQLNTI